MTLAEYGIIVALKPTGGGWRYPQPFAGKLVTIVPEQAPVGRYGNFGDKLCAAVRLFRRQQGLPEGDIESDVAEFIRRASPQNDYYRGKTPENIGKPRLRELKPMIESIREWVDDMSLRKPAIVNPDEAIERAQVCISCPQNIRWQIKCAPCVAEVVSRGDNLRATMLFDYDDALLACRCHKMYLPAAVFIDRDNLSKRSDKAPENCWLPKNED